MKHLVLRPKIQNVNSFRLHPYQLILLLYIPMDSKVHDLWFQLWRGIVMTTKIDTTDTPASSNQQELLAEELNYDYLFTQKNIHLFGLSENTREQLSG